MKDEEFKTKVYEWNELDITYHERLDLGLKERPTISQLAFLLPRISCMNSCAPSGSDYRYDEYSVQKVLDYAFKLGQASVK